jgi:hypothetical protein
MATVPCIVSESTTYQAHPSDVNPSTAGFHLRVLRGRTGK